jgi:hypothetical protein
MCEGGHLQFTLHCVAL